MLWTDSDFVSTDDLSSVDPDVVPTASAENITLTGSNGMIRRGIEEAGRYLEAALVSFATYISSNDISANHLNAVFYTGSQPNQRRRATLDQIVVTGRNAGYWSDLKTWAVNRVLIAFYRAASNKSQKDRYTNKFEQFSKRDIYDTWPLLKKSGIPIVYRPIPVPGAVQARDPGTWSVGMTAGAGTVSGKYDVAITYVDQTKYIDKSRVKNAESDRSEIKSVTLSSSNVITADISALHPPYGAVAPDLLGLGYCVPGRATGWNLYVGLNGGTLYLQNPEPYPITITGPQDAIPTLGGTTSATLAGDPVLSGYTPGIGQYPETHLAIHDLINRG